MNRFSEPGDWPGADPNPPARGYKLIRRIGSGGIGEVWQAEAPGGISVAVKVLFRSVDHEEAQRELHALRLIRQLRHPHLLAMQAYWSLEDRLYIAMELADGSLRDRLKECRREGRTGIPVAELIRCFREAAEALDFLHSQGVLHRDVKPDNLLLIQKHVKVADFSLALVFGSGTPAYMAPEVWRKTASEHSDQYSLAVSYAVLRLDRPLFSGRSIYELMLGHISQPPDLTPMSEAEQGVLLRALAKDPADRYPSCGGFVQALRQAAGTD